MVCTQQNRKLHLCLHFWRTNIGRQQSCTRIHQGIIPQHWRLLLTQHQCIIRLERRARTITNSTKQSASNRLLAPPNILKQLSMVPDQWKLAWRRNRRKRRMHIQLYLKLRSILYSAKHRPHSLDKRICTRRTHRRRIRRQHGGQHDDVNFAIRMQVCRNSHQRSTIPHFRTRQFDKLHGLGSNRPENWRTHMVAESYSYTMATNGSSDAICFT